MLWATLCALLVVAATPLKRAAADRDNPTSRITQPVSLRSYRGVVESLSRRDPMGFTACTPKSARSAHRCHICARDLNFNPPEEWRQDIDQTLFPGGYFKEFIFFHKKSKALVLTETIINIELDKMTEPWRTATKLSGMYYPRGQIFFGMRLPLWLQQRKAKAAFAKIHAWRPERVVLSHGRCFESHGNEVVERIFGGAAPLK